MEIYMRSITVFIVFIFASILFVIPALAAGPWNGRIIDMETKEPIEGAVVLAVWQRAYRTPAGDNTYFYNAKEVLTDKEGRYEIPLYRPINLLPIISYIREPEFIIFKPGYLSIEIKLNENVTDKAVDLPEKGKVFRLSPGLIELPKLNTREERLKSLHTVETAIDSSAPEEKFKNMLKMIDTENKNLGFRK